MHPAFLRRAKRERGYRFAYIFSGLQPLKMAAHPCTAGTSDKSEVPYQRGWLRDCVEALAHIDFTVPMLYSAPIAELEPS